MDFIFQLFSQPKNSSYLLYEALRKKDFETAKSLIKEGAKFDGRSILQLDFQDIDLLKHAIDAGIDVNYKGNSAMSSFGYIVGHGSLDIIKYMVEKGNACTTDSLTFIRSNRSRNLLEYLYEHGADINANDNEPLINAVNYGMLDFIIFLREKGANFNIPLKYDYNITCIKYLVQYGTKVTDDFFINFVKFIGDIDTTQFLIYSGANIKECGIIALQESLSRHHYDMVKLLVDNGVSVKSIKRGIFPPPSGNILHYMKYTKLVEYLVKKGAELDIGQNLDTHQTLD